MATKPDSTATFIGKLLAPLPGDVEQVSSKQHKRALLEDAKREWHFYKLKMLAMRSYWLADSTLLWHAQLYRPDDVQMRQEVEEESNYIYLMACEALMKIPSPTLGALRWKESVREFGGGLPEWELHIAADAAKFGVPFTPRRADRVVSGSN